MFKSWLKHALAFLGILIAVLLALAIWEGYKIERQRDAVLGISDALKREQEENYRRAMADTYGGKTPQETLRMYIDAVEKGDYELASKYFIEKNREKELQSWSNASPEFKDQVLDMLEQSIKSQGSYSSDKTGFVISDPLLVDFILYPNGVWKIIEI